MNKSQWRQDLAAKSKRTLHFVVRAYDATMPHSHPTNHQSTAAISATSNTAKI